jgi:molybdopterin molybdotransferase
MVSVAEAESIILSNKTTNLVTEVEIAHAIGYVLAEEIKADRDFPPFNRVAMDGIAINYTAYEQGRREFQISGVQAAGSPPQNLPNHTHAVEVMTGAMLPAGADTVIRYEDLEIKQSIARILTESVTRNQNVHTVGQDAKQGDLLLEPCIRISPSEIALIASVGKNKVRIYTLPRIAIVSTGDELIAIEEHPLPWQVRRSNVYALQAALSELNVISSIFHIKDDEEVLNLELNKILNEFDVIILSGGVSKGKFDFVPLVLEAQGIKKLFHQVTQKPGKPFWFGKGDTKIVFALPGNPVSTHLCFYRYIKPWIMSCLGLPAKSAQAILATDFTFKAPLTYFLQVKVKHEQGKLLAYPDAGGGSGDFVNLKNVDGFLELPSTQSEFKAGEVLTYYAFRQ